MRDCLLCGPSHHAWCPEPPTFLFTQEKQICRNGATVANRKSTTDDRSNAIPCGLGRPVQVSRSGEFPQRARQGPRRYTDRARSLRTHAMIRIVARRASLRPGRTQRPVQTR